MARFVRALYRQQLHHLAEVRMYMAEMTCRHQQRGVLILDQVGHHLHHCIFDLVRQIGHGLPVDCRRRVPLPGQRLLVQVCRSLGPDLGFFAESEIEAGAAGLDRRAARRHTPVRVGMFGHGLRRLSVRRAMTLGAVPATRLERTAHDIRMVSVEGDCMAIAAAPGQQVHIPVGRAAGHAQGFADLERRQRAPDQQVRALIESERLNIDSFVR